MRHLSPPSSTKMINWFPTVLTKKGLQSDKKSDKETIKQNFFPTLFFMNWFLCQIIRKLYLFRQKFSPSLLYIKFSSFCFFLFEMGSNITKIFYWLLNLSYCRHFNVGVIDPTAWCIWDWQLHRVEVNKFSIGCKRKLLFSWYFPDGMKICCKSDLLVIKLGFFFGIFQDSCENFWRKSWEDLVILWWKEVKFKELKMLSVV
jgi:hypothetical protein